MDRDVIIITEAEIKESIACYEKAMKELATLLGAKDHWGDVCVAFGHWSNTRDEPWQVLFIEAKHYIRDHGVAPWQ